MEQIDLKLDESTLKKIKKSLLRFNRYHSILPLLFVITTLISYSGVNNLGSESHYLQILYFLIGITAIILTSFLINRNYLKKYAIIENGVLTKAIFEKWIEIKNTEDSSYKLTYHYYESLIANRKDSKIDEKDKWLIFDKSNANNYVFLIELSFHLEIDLFSKIAEFIPKETNQ